MERFLPMVPLFAPGPGGDADGESSSALLFEDFLPGYNHLIAGYDAFQGDMSVPAMGNVNVNVNVSAWPGAGPSMAHMQAGMAPTYAQMGMTGAPAPMASVSMQRGGPTQLPTPPTDALPAPPAPAAPNPRKRARGVPDGMHAAAAAAAAEEEEAPAGGRGKRKAARAASARLSAVLDAARAAPGSTDEDEDFEEDGGDEPRGRRRGGAAGRSAAGSIMGTTGGSNKPRFSGAAASIMASAAAEAAAKVQALDAGGARYDDEEYEDDDDESHRGAGGTGRDSRSRERNRVHARKSRLRKKFFVDALKANLDHLEVENRRLRAFLEAKLGRSADVLLAEAAADPRVTAIAANLPGPSTSSSSSGRAAPPRGADASGPGTVLAAPGQAPTSVLDRSDYALVEALSKSQQNFVVSDPNLPDNPIVFASGGFYELTGYKPEETIGRNCRFLQGPQTDPEALAVIRKGIAEGRDTAVCLINYRKDGSPFWNSFFVAPLRGVDGRIVNFVGVQCEVSESVAVKLIEAQRAAASKLLRPPQAAPLMPSEAHGGYIAPLPPLPQGPPPAAAKVRLT